MIEVLRAKKNNLEELNIILEKTKKKMIIGNNNQWTKTYPTREHLQRDIGEGQLFMVQINEEIAGYVTLAYCSSSEYYEQPWIITENILYIQRLIVNPKFQKKGVGTILINFCENEAKKRNVCAIHSSTHFRNIPMQYLFLNNGFQQRSQFQMKGREEIGVFLSFEKILVKKMMQKILTMRHNSCIVSHFLL